jgi:hypothetical protein
MLRRLMPLLLTLIASASLVAKRVTFDAASFGGMLLAARPRSACYTAISR